MSKNRQVHAAARIATRAIRQAREWTSNNQYDESLRLAEQLLDELSTYASLRTDPEVAPADAQARLVQFLDGLLLA